MVVCTSIQELCLKCVTGISMKERWDRIPLGDNFSKDGWTGSIQHFTSPLDTACLSILTFMYERLSSRMNMLLAIRSGGARAGAATALADDVCSHNQRWIGKGSLLRCASQKQFLELSRGVAQSCMHRHFNFFSLSCTYTLHHCPRQQL